MNQAAGVLGDWSAAAADLVATLKLLARTRALDMDAYFGKLVPEPDGKDLTGDGYARAVRRRERILAEIRRRHDDAMGSETLERGTLWAAYNAVTETVDHYLAAGARSDRAEYAWFGGGSELRIAALAEAARLAGAA